MRQIMMGLLLLVGACGSKDAALCKSSIKKSLINPETVQFFESNSITRADYSDEVKAAILADKNLRREEWSSYKGSLSPEYDTIVAGGDRIGAKQYSRQRVKAASKIGLNVTSNYICASDGKDFCACLPQAD